MSVMTHSTSLLDWFFVFLPFVFDCSADVSPLGCSEFDRSRRLHHLVSVVSWCYQKKLHWQGLVQSFPSFSWLLIWKALGLDEMCAR